MHYEEPEPGDIPGIAERVRRVTDAEYAEYAAAHGFTELPKFVAPDLRTTAVVQRIETTLRIKGSQFHLLDYGGRQLANILPIPPGAESAETLVAMPEPPISSPLPHREIRLPAADLEASANKPLIHS
ncbi:hypothetical protein [Nocardia yunnanensis]|uniref:hypothetical protein n=1 Tax=Nocardia yunnanensis TaxID=2382165 RepID=UPI0013C51CBF|nr:hypothetical protein [Nocardia yunnanensis]